MSDKWDKTSGIMGFIDYVKKNNIVTEDEYKDLVFIAEDELLYSSICAFQYGVSLASIVIAENQNLLEQTETERDVAIFSKLINVAEGKETYIHTDAEVSMKNKNYSNHNLRYLRALEKQIAISFCKYVAGIV
jgi:hypothetical protein